MVDHTPTRFQFSYALKSFMFLSKNSSSQSPRTPWWYTHLWRKCILGLYRGLMLFQTVIKGISMIYRISQAVRQSRVRVHKSQHWQDCRHDGDARVLVTLVVPGRPCWVCTKIKWEVPGHPQAICLYCTCCGLWLCSLCKNSCFLKWNKSKGKGGKHSLQLRKKSKHRGPSLKEFWWVNYFVVDWQPQGSCMIFPL